MDEEELVGQLQEIERRMGRGVLGADACRAQLAEWRRREADQEFQVSLPTAEAQGVLVTWCVRYGVTPYRKTKQRRTTICIRVPRSFMHDVLWPQVDAMSRAIETAKLRALTRVLERWSGEPLPMLQPPGPEDGE